MKTARKRFDDKTVLFREGEKGGGAYVILAGRVDLFKEGRSGAVPLASLGKGDLVGEMALIDKGPRSATAVTVGEVVLQGLDREDLLARFARDPEMAMKILAKLSKRLRNTDDRVVSLTDRLMETGVALDDSGATPIADSEAVDANRGGFFERLLRAFRFSSSAARSAAEGGGGGVPAPVPPGRPFQVLVAGIEGDPDGGLQQALPDLLEIAEIMNAKKLARFIGDPTRDPPLTPYQSYQEGCRTATETEADLLIWGLCDAEAGLLYLRFAAPGLHAHAHEDDRIGAPGALTFLTLPFLAPSQLDEPWVTLLRCVVLAAMDPRSETHVQILAENLPAFTEAAQAIGTAPPQEYTPLEQAGVLTCYANAAATVGNHAGGSDWYGLAVDCYGAAIGLLPREADGEWAALHRAVGVVLQAMGERNGDLEALQQAADAYGAALEAMLPKETPREWAALQNRMGMVRFKLHMAAGELDALRQPVSDLQAALQIYNRSEHPYRWAEVINNLAQVLQVYGDHLRSTEVLQRAVDCCHQALEVRRFEAQPLLWAVTQNNLGSALFMLAKHTQKREFLEEAREAFQKALGTYKLHNVKRLAAVAKKNLRRVDGLLESKEMREVVDPEWALPQTVEVGEQDWIDADEGASERAPGKKGAS